MSVCKRLVPVGTWHPCVLQAGDRVGVIGSLVAFSGTVGQLSMEGNRSEQ
jgi:hypothetical protein